MTRRRLYYLREKLKRARRYRDEYQAEVDRKLAEIAQFGRVTSPGTLDYPKAKVEKYTKQIEELEALDLRTDEEKRGLKRKPYVRSKDLVFRGMPDEVVEKIERRMAREQAERERWQAEHARLVATPGTPERLAEYERRRWFLRDLLQYHTRARTLMASQAIAERHGRELDLAKCDREALDEYIDLLAQLHDLDQEFEDVAYEQITPWCTDKDHSSSF